MNNHCFCMFFRYIGVGIGIGWVSKALGHPQDHKKNIKRSPIQRSKEVFLVDFWSYKLSVFSMFFSEMFLFTYKSGFSVLYTSLQPNAWFCLVKLDFGDVWNPLKREKSRSGPI